MNGYSPSLKREYEKHFSEKLGQYVRLEEREGLIEGFVDDRRIDSFDTVAAAFDALDALVETKKENSEQERLMSLYA